MIGVWKEATPSTSSATPTSCARGSREMAEQMQGAQQVAWADNAIKLAVDMTVAAINRLDLDGLAATSRRCRSATRSGSSSPRR